MALFVPKELKPKLLPIPVPVACADEVLAAPKLSPPIVGFPLVKKQILSFKEKIIKQYNEIRDLMAAS